MNTRYPLNTAYVRPGNEHKAEGGRIYIQDRRIERERHNLTRRRDLDAIGWAILAVLLLAGAIWLASVLIIRPEVFK